jgi:O-methyltransferase
MNVDVSPEAFIRQAVEAALERPARMMVWGTSQTTARLLATLRELGLDGAVTSVVDDRPSRAGVRVAGWTVERPDDVTDWDVTHLVVGLDAEKEDVLRGFAARGTGTPAVLAYGSAQYDFRDEIFWDLVGSSYVRSLTGGYRHVLVHIYQCLRYIADRRLPGDIVEFGVFKGGTTIFMSRLLHRLKHEATILGFDTFTGFPDKRSVLDTYAYDGDEFADFEVVRANCALRGNIELIDGDISETCTRLAGRALALSFFDTDNYSAARAALEICAAQTVPGGVIVFDHYHSPEWPQPLGERMAAQEVLFDGQWFNLYATGVFLKIGT